MDYIAFRSWYRIAMYSLIVSAVVSGYFTAKGLMVEGSGLPEALLRTAFAVVAAIIGWRFIFNYFPKANKRNRIRMIWGMVALVIVLLCISTYYATGGLLEKRILNKSMQMSLSETEETLHILLEKVQRETELIVPLNLAVASFDSVVRREKDTGVLSGRRGAGRVSGNVEGLSDSLKSLVFSLEEQASQAEALKNRGERLLADLYVVLSNDELAMHEKMERHRAGMSELNNLMMKLNTTQLPAIESAIMNMEDTALIADGETLGDIKNIVEKNRSMLLAQLALISREEITIKPHLVNDMRAEIWSNIGYCTPELLAALATDLFFPLMLLTILDYVARTSRTGRPKQETERHGKAAPITRENLVLQAARERHHSRPGDGRITREGQQPQPETG